MKTEITKHEVNEDSPFNPDLFQEREMSDKREKNHIFYCNLGTFTVLKRITGLGSYDTETAWRDLENNFWLAMGDFDVRFSKAKTIGEAIAWLKANAGIHVPKDKFLKSDETIQVS